MKGTKRECPENDGQGASDPNGLQGTAPRRRRVQFAAETKIHCVEREAEPEDVEKSPGLHPAVSAAPEETPSQAEMLDAQYTKETVEDLRRKKKALAAGVHRLGLGPRGFDFNVFDSAAAAHAAGEADPDQADAGEVPLEPFNMRREMQEGTFDGDGNYLWRKTNPDEVSDPWLDSLGETKGDLVRSAYTAPPPLSPFPPSPSSSLSLSPSSPLASEAALQSHATRHQQPPAPEVTVDVQDSIRKILCILNQGETPSRALRRLAEGAPSRGAPVAGAPHGPSQKGKARKQREEQWRLLLMFWREWCLAGERRPSGPGAYAYVYFLTKTQLEEMLQSEKAEANEHGAALSSSSGEVDPVYWQFRWLGNSNDKEIHGPYSSENFRTWIDQNFISERNPVEVRRVSAANDPLDGVWLNWVSVDFRSDEQTQKDMQLQEERDARWEAEEDARLQKEAGRGRQAMKEEDDDD
ncbi:cd2 antigen cytoplasmic tail-binding protein [Cyclospora cayetanensis]|uniref:Cd2 antigen cytoplasmic tail-binding protein n=1 Tax=Cyclospora cayetanensis TaxID=88456 RepID=A0A1D3CS81_9EIME|nr:cd2 antigen cytoplasmic tail-binding protein [Cyclospora cayetanensis]